MSDSKINALHIRRCYFKHVNSHMDRASIYTMNIIVLPSFITTSLNYLTSLRYFKSPIISTSSCLWPKYTAFTFSQRPSSLRWLHHTGQNSRSILRAWTKQSGLLEPELQQTSFEIKHEIKFWCVVPSRGDHTRWRCQTRVSRYTRQDRK